MGMDHRLTVVAVTCCEDIPIYGSNSSRWTEVPHLATAVQSSDMSLALPQLYSHKSGFLERLPLLYPYSCLGHLLCLTLLQLKSFTQGLGILLPADLSCSCP